MSGLVASAGRFRHVVFVSSEHGVAREVRRALPGGSGALGPATPFAGGLHVGASVSGRASTFPDHPSTFTLSPEERDFISWLFHTASLDVRRYKAETLCRRLPACLRAVRAGSVAEARFALENAPQLCRTALGALVIGVTQFFRDGPFFSCLIGQILPSLVARAQFSLNATPATKAVRIWSVGCSDGPELYSVAMLLAEHGVLERCELLGTDCRRDAVERARAGVFDSASLRGMPLDLLARYFTAADSAGSRWSVSPVLRQAIHWRTANALTVDEPGTWDWVLCRNLAIYLQPEAAVGLWKKLQASLRPDGVLALGKAERPTGATRLVPIGPCLYRLAAPESQTTRAGLTGASDVH